MPALTNEWIPTAGSEAVDKASADEVFFDPGAHFDEWLRSVKHINRHAESIPGSASQQYSQSSATYLDSINASECELSFEGILHFGGHLRGHLRSTNGVLVLSDLGSIEAEIEVRVAVINGMVRGNITASERVVLGSHAKVMGQVNTPSLEINCGGNLVGSCFAGSPGEEIPAGRRGAEKPKTKAVGA